MEFSYFLLTILAGIFGTVFMTAVMYAYSRITGKETRVIHILGSMLTGRSDLSVPISIKALIAGSVSHFTIGIMFSLGYFLLWNWEVFQIEFLDSVIIGALSGLLSIITWYSYFSLHLRPPKIPFTNYFFVLFIAHIVFGIVTVNVFGLLTDEPEFWYRMNNNLPEEVSLFHLQCGE